MSGGNTPTARVGSQPYTLTKKTSSFFGIKVQPSMNNIDKMRQSTAQHTKAEEFHYKPKVSQSFLKGWLNYPVDRRFSVVANSYYMWLVWLQWTNKGMAGLDPLDTSIRSRVCNQLSIQGTAAGLFLVIAVAGFLVPPDPRETGDPFWVNVFGCIMFTASVSLVLYIALALTVTYPLIESLRDDVAFDAFENYQNQVGGQETYLFFIGMQLVLLALLVAARILYADAALYFMLAALFVIFGFMVYLARKVFLSLDPISAMHLGLSNDKDQQYRAELLSHFILRKVPNTLIQDESGKEFFERKRESQKLELTRSQKLRQRHAPLRTSECSGEEEADGFSELGHTATASTLSRTRSNVEMFTRVHSKVIRAGDMIVEDFEDDDAAAGGRTPKMAYQVPPVVVPNPTVAVETVRADVARRASMERMSSLPPLKQMFCDPDTYVGKSTGLSLVDSVAVYAYITQAGCETTEDLLLTLKESKAHRPCTCSRDSNADAGTSSHAEQCSSRRAGVWIEALTSVGVPYFHAIKVVRALRPYL